MIKNIRLTSHQLTGSKFDNPQQLVAYMGAIQAQQYDMAKWAIGIRLKSGTLQAVNQALQKGEIIRTHILRPTWHFVSVNDIRWMMELSAKRIKAANDSYGKKFDIPQSTFSKCNKLLVRLLEGGNHLTKQEVTDRLLADKAISSADIISRVISRAEIECLICSGIDKNKKYTYALFDERVPQAPKLHRDEALAQLALRYLRSHSPATLADYIWWSGLTTTEARKSIHLIRHELYTETFDGQETFIHQSYNKRIKTGETLHLLPSYDEYLISYKNRTGVLHIDHHPKAFNNWGIFYPVILRNGQVVGNWKKVQKSRKISIETDLFHPDINIDEKLMAQAVEKYTSFLQ